MLEQALYHKPETEYCYPISENTIALRLRASKTDALQVDVVYGGKYDFYEKRQRARMRLSYTDRLYNYFTAELTLSDVRLVYVFELKEGDGIYYFSEDGLTEKYDYHFNFYNAFQFAYINAADVHRQVEWMKNARFYQIFIDRFARGNFDKDDRYINLEWGTVPGPKSYAGGDLRGVTENLGYIAGLGANAIYLTPFFRSVSNHKYDIEDYFTVDGMFGDEEDIRKLVTSAHERGMRVVMDAVFNHVSARCRQFADVAEKGKNSPYFDWFIIHGDKIDREKVNYECFASCDYMPKWNTSNEAVQEYLIGVGLYWLQKYDIDGWRLDVSDEVSHAFWRKFRDAVKKIKPECAIIGENWHDANAYLKGDQYDSIMNYAFTKACLDFFVLKSADAKAFAEKLNALLMRNTDTVNCMMLNLLDSHDTHRFLTEAGGDVKKLESALAVLYLFVGVPCIYYGTEIGMEGGYDPDCRRTMDWEKARKGSSLTQLVRALAGLKERRKCLHRNEFRAYAEGEAFVMERGELRLVVNGGETPLPLRKNICTNAEGRLRSFEFMIEEI